MPSQLHRACRSGPELAARPAYCCRAAALRAACVRRLPAYHAHCELHVLGDEAAARKVWEDAVASPLGRCVRAGVGGHVYVRAGVWQRTTGQGTGRGSFSMTHDGDDSDGGVVRAGTASRGWRTLPWSAGCATWRRRVRCSGARTAGSWRRAGARRCARSGCGWSVRRAGARGEGGEGRGRAGAAQVVRMCAFARGTSAAGGVLLRAASNGASHDR